MLSVVVQAVCWGSQQPGLTFPVSVPVQHISTELAMRVLLNARNCGSRSLNLCAERGLVPPLLFLDVHI